VKDFVPVDLKRKRSITRLLAKNGTEQTLSIGAPQVIRTFCSLSTEDGEHFDADVAELARKGYRSLAVAIGEGEKEEGMRLVGIIALSDTLREDASDVVSFLEAQGIRVSVVTGDNVAITKEIVRKLLGREGKVWTRDAIKTADWSGSSHIFETIDAFSEILPDDKYALVKHAKTRFVVAANGDGINDLPAVREANVGICVQSGVDALKSGADIVLLSDGIAVIKDAIVEARQIFQRLYGYSLYRISESQRLIITVVVLGLLYHTYPLTPIQVILLALLNDIPIISLAFDRVQLSKKPSHINVRKQFLLSSLFGATGIINSLLFFWLLYSVLHVSWAIIQTLFFLRLTVSGHMLIFVSHTAERWFRFLPSREVIIATITTQLVASAIVYFGIFMPRGATIGQIGFVWLWAFFFMQISEGMKFINRRFVED
jgi:H+-transporting ATPase